MKSIKIIYAIKVEDVIPTTGVVPKCSPKNLPSKIAGVLCTASSDGGFHLHPASPDGSFSTFRKSPAVPCFFPRGTAVPCRRQSAWMSRPDGAARDGRLNCSPERKDQARNGLDSRPEINGLRRECSGIQSCGDHPRKC